MKKTDRIAATLVGMLVTAVGTIAIIKWLWTRL
jgi:hypothetical protein